MAPPTAAGPPAVILPLSARGRRRLRADLRPRAAVSPGYGVFCVLGWRKCRSQPHHERDLGLLR
eukprot:507608-Alexandrium_andersonii.AAC.1